MSFVLRTRSPSANSLARIWATEGFVMPRGVAFSLKVNQSLSNAISVLPKVCSFKVIILGSCPDGEAADERTGVLWVYRTFAPSGLGHLARGTCGTGEGASHLYWERGARREKHQPPQHPRARQRPWHESGLAPRRSRQAVGVGPSWHSNSAASR